MDPDGRWTSTRAVLLAAAGQNCWPPAGSYMAATGQDLMAADTGTARPGHGLVRGGSLRGHSYSVCVQTDSSPVEWLRQFAPDPDLCSLRKTTIIAVASGLEEFGVMLQALGSADGAAVDVSGTDGSDHDAVLAIGVLTRIAAELVGVSGRLLSGSHHYAGAALLRQVVEIEYLTWAFAYKQRDAVDWLNSTHEERVSLFTPAQLRKTSGGRFNTRDYRNHCEQGGHPVPLAAILLGGANRGSAQVLLVDLLLHCWRIADNLSEWLRASSAALDPIAQPLVSVKLMLSKWGDRDPLYAWACSMDDPDVANASTFEG